MVATGGRVRAEIVSELTGALLELSCDRVLLHKLSRAARTAVSFVAQASLQIQGLATGIEIAGAGYRRSARRICQALILLPLFSLVLLPEYVQGLGDPASKSALYRVTLGPLRIVDLLLLGLIAAHGVAWASSRRLRVSVPRELALPGLGFMAAIAFAMIYGWLQGGDNLFFDWRALALGVGLYGVFGMWVQSEEEAGWAVQLFAGYIALRVSLIFVDFARGGGDVIVGVRIPVFDGPTLSAAVFAAVLALCLSDTSASRGRSLLWSATGAAGYLLVLMCFRRTFWTELGVATLLLLLAQKQRRARKLLLATAAIVGVAAALGPCRAWTSCRMKPNSAREIQTMWAKWWMRGSRCSNTQ